MMKKLLCAILVLMLMMTPLYAFAQARMPEIRGNINDSADVLSTQVAADLAEFSKQISKKADVDLYVATVHFLDGMDVQAYADALFARWELTEEDILLVCAAGEDSFAVSMGEDVQSMLGKTNVDNLFYITSEFATLFRSQQYDSAFAMYAFAFNNLVEKQTGNGVRMDKLFTEVVPDAADEAGDEAFELWNDVMDSINQSAYDYNDSYDQSAREENGVTAGGWLVLIILIVIVTRQGRKDRNGGKGGCGCLPFTLIMAVLALALLSAIF
ncbi:MAG: TPM domain-containing protein [Clostridia bacterium]|nr:TPM domain-containing protein [Clostridia bacterium]